MDAYNTYISLRKQLIQLEKEGKLDSEEADALRDQMDEPWWKMTEKERQRVEELGKMDEPFSPGQRVSLNVEWQNGRVSRMTGRLILIKNEEAYVETELGSVVGPANSLEQEPEEE